MNIAYNEDCVEAMKKMPDNAFDLAVVDPPYGDPSGGGGVQPLRGTLCAVRDSGGRSTAQYTGNRHGGVDRTGGTWAAKFGKKIVAWDVAPGKEYFEQLFRVSRNQVIWGGNYFSLPPTRCFLIWRKTNVPQNFTMSMAEYAWTSYKDRNAKVFDFNAQGQPNRWHPTQKPIELYKWIYSMFTEPGMKILDTHLGSGTSRRAAHDMGLDFTGYEIDKDYFDRQEKDFEEHTAQVRFF